MKNGKQVNGVIWGFFIGLMVLNSQSIAKDEWGSLDFRQVKVGGDFERRIDMLRTNNLVKVDLEKNFLHLLKSKESKPGVYLGIGKFMTGTTHFGGVFR